jgi:hypothetical protein
MRRHVEQAVSLSAAHRGRNSEPHRLIIRPGTRLSFLASEVLSMPDNGYLVQAVLTVLCPGAA